eukprot:2913990-Pleurochrysis_carterae.AAC.2
MPLPHTPARPLPLRFFPSSRAPLPSVSVPLVQAPPHAVAVSRRGCLMTSPSTVVTPPLTFATGLIGRRRER